MTWREQYPLESTKPLKKTLASVGIVVIILIIGSIVAYVKSVGQESIPLTTLWLWAIPIGIIAFILKYIYEVFYMKYYFYDATSDVISIKKGVFSRNEITLPFKRLQDVYVDQDILDRIFGLYDVHVSSATSTSATLSHIDGLNKDNAEKVKTLLLEKIHKGN